MALAAVVEMFVRKGDDPPPEVHASIGGSSARAARFLVTRELRLPLTKGMVEVLSHGFDERLKVTSAGRRVLRDIPTLLFRSNAAFLAGRVTEILGSDGTSSLHPFPFLVLSS